MLFPNIPSPTLGGNVFWDTVESKDGWRLQRHKGTNHWRILDSENIRHAWGPASAEGEIKHTFGKYTN